MSAADGWDLTVPEDTDELLAELRRHGVTPGQRLHIVQTHKETVDRPDEAPVNPRSRRTLGFVGSIHDAPSDLAENTDEYLRRGFGQR